MADATTKVYGRSDVISVSVPEGPDSVECQHEFKRVKAPTAWEPNRTVPVSDCADCAGQLLKQGWKDDPRKVELTPDEQTQHDLAKEEGDAMVGSMGRAFAEAAANEVAKARKPAAEATGQPADDPGDQSTPGAAVTPAEPVATKKAGRPKKAVAA
jgi:hypothetical protein